MRFLNSYPRPEVSSPIVKRLLALIILSSLINVNVASAVDDWFEPYCWDDGGYPNQTLMVNGPYVGHYFIYSSYLDWAGHQWGSCAFWSLYYLSTNYLWMNVTGVGGTQWIRLVNETRDEVAVNASPLSTFPEGKWEFVRTGDDNVHLYIDSVYQGIYTTLNSPMSDIGIVSFADEWGPVESSFYLSFQESSLPYANTNKSEYYLGEPVRVDYYVPENGILYIRNELNEPVDNSPVITGSGYAIFPFYSFWNYYAGNYSVVLYSYPSLEYLAHDNFTIISDVMPPSVTPTPYPTPPVPTPSFTPEPCVTGTVINYSCLYPTPTPQDIGNASGVSGGLTYINDTLKGYNYSFGLSFAVSNMNVFWNAIPAKVLAVILFGFGLEIVLLILKGKS